MANSSQKNKCLLSFWPPRGPFPHKIVPVLFVGYVNNGFLLGLVSLSADIEDKRLKDVPAKVTFMQTYQWICPWCLPSFREEGGRESKIANIVLQIISVWLTPFCGGWCLKPVTLV